MTRHFPAQIMEIRRHENVVVRAHHILRRIFLAIKMNGSGLLEKKGRRYEIELWNQNYISIPNFLY